MMRWCGRSILPSPLIPHDAWLTLLCVLQGLLLDCDAATLTVYVNGERQGVMVRPGMTFDAPDDDCHGEPVARLDGPLRWAVDLIGPSDSVGIDGPLPPPAS